MNVTIYMFHAIGKVDSEDWADGHYAYSKDKFIEFLRQSKSILSLEFARINKIKEGIIVTFDDGHISNYWAAKYILEHNYGVADFFINPELVGNKYYMDWDQIREISALGMSIQSHGLDHRYLSDCTYEELDKQLLYSKEMIEEKISKEVSIIAPPGGRFDDRTVRLSKEIGYRCIANSRPGKVDDILDFLQPRIAVNKNHDVQSLLSATKKLSFLMLKQKFKYRILFLVKKILGNKNYEKFRLVILGGGK